MAYCPNCGNPVAENQQVCLYCGKILLPNVNSQQPKATEEGGVFGYAVLGFFIPLVGLILYAIWAKSRPKAAKAAGIGALITVLVGIVLYVIVIIWMVQNIDFTEYVPTTWYNM